MLGVARRLLMPRVTDTWLTATPARLAMLSVTAARAVASLTKAAGSETARAIVPLIVLTICTVVEEVLVSDVELELVSDTVE